MPNNIFQMDRQKQYILIFCAVAGLALLLWAAWYALLRTPFVPTFSNVKPVEAASIISELDALKIPYDFDEAGGTILVPSDKQAAARVKILGGELPMKGGVGFELFNKSDMGLTEFAQRINYLRALQGELGRTIMGLEEIESARVHLSIPESGLFEKDRRAARASVTLVAKPGEALDERVVRGIQQLVASAVPDLSAANVVILDARGQMLSIEPATASATDEAAVLGSTPEEVDFQQAIRGALLGAGFSTPMRIGVTAYGPTSHFEGGAEEQTPETLNAERHYPLRVEISIPSEPADGLKTRMLVVVKDAIGYQHALGDVVIINADSSLVPPSSVRAAMPLARTVVAGGASGEAGPKLSGLWVIAAFVPAVLLLIALLLRKLAGPRRLSETERHNFSARLKELVAAETKHVNE